MYELKYEVLYGIYIGFVDWQLLNNLSSLEPFRTKVGSGNPDIEN